MAQAQIKNQNSAVRGIIFDLDGTLIKSVVDFPRMKTRMIEFINELPISKPNYIITQTTNEIISDLNKRMTDQGITEGERNRILVEISKILTEVEFENLAKVELLPGVKEFILMCANMGIKLGILTRASREYLMASLEQTGIKQYFSVILSRDEFTLLKAKPHPYALKFTIKELEVPPEKVIFVGDHEIDFRCAKEGNIRFVGVLSGAYDEDRFKNIGCEFIVKNFHELSELIKELNN
jgi:phosphoglycolate phosphatase-like HAD superfamily hydrolase